MIAQIGTFAKAVTGNGASFSLPLSQVDQILPGAPENGRARHRDFAVGESFQRKQDVQHALTFTAAPHAFTLYP